MFADLLIDPEDFTFKISCLIEYGCDGKVFISRAPDYHDWNDDQQPWILSTIHESKLKTFPTLKQARQYAEKTFPSNSPLVFKKSRLNYYAIPPVYPKYNPKLSPMLTILPSLEINAWTINSNIVKEIEDVTKQTISVNFKTRKDAIIYLHSILSQNLHLFYSPYKYQRVKEDLIRKGFTQNSHEYSTWYLLFVKPEIDLAKIFKK